MHESDALPGSVIPAAEPAEVQRVEPAPMQPVQLDERVAIVDILRGFALLGILCVNMQFYTTPLMDMITGDERWPENHNQAATFLIKMFTEGKFYILFSFLFGLGISIQLMRADVRGSGFAWHHVKRMLILLLFGTLHAYLLWMGDILTTYALLGLLFTAVVRLPAWILAILAGAVYTLPVIVWSFFMLLGMLFDGGGGDGPNFLLKLGFPSAEEAVRVYSSGTFWEIFRVRALEVLIGYPIVFLEMGPDVVAMFTLGFCAGKLRVFENLASWRPFLRRWRWPALALGLAGNSVYALAHMLPEGRQPSLLAIGMLWGAAAGAPALTFFYVSTIVLFAESPLGIRVLAPIACVGRMALTNYLLQSVICTTIFYSYGGGLYAGIGPLAGLALTVVIYLPQIPFSMLWLSRFRFGPMEWLWRTLTYGKLQPMRLQ